MATLPTTHDELRARLEAAGVSPEQIAKVMNRPSPEKHLPEAPPPAYDSRGRFGKLTHPTQNSPATCKTTFKAHFISGPDPKKIYQKIALDGLPKTQAAWSLELLTKPGLTSKEPHLRIWRQDDGDIRGHQVCQCTFHHRLSHNVEIVHPWVTWQPWDSTTEPWCSDVGFLDSAWMKWEYDVEDEWYPDRVVLRCVTVGEWSAGTNQGETCRVVLSPDGLQPTLIRLRGPAWHEATEEMLDEMVSNAMVQCWRRHLGWYAKPSSGGGGGGSDSSGIASVNASTSATLAGTTC